MTRPDAPAFEKIVRCPTCGGESVYSPKNEARPFCSVRCKNVDFGAWASEDFRMPEAAVPSPASESNPLSH